MSDWRKITIISTLIVIAALVITACAPAAPAQPAAEQAPAAAEQPTEAPKEAAAPEAQEVVFTYVEGQVISTIDPAKHVDESSLHAVINLYDPFLRPKLEENSMEPGPWVAESWEISEDGLTYTFKIRQGIKFHDGSELTAEDVQFSMERMLALKKGFSWLWQGVLEPGSTEVIDDYTVAFHLNQPYAPFLATLIQLFIVNKDLVMANLQPGDFGEMQDYGQAFLEDNEAGSGPYVKESWDRGSKFVFRRFPDYWKGWEPGQIDKVNYLIVTEEATKKTLLQSGEADMVDQWMTAESYEELAKNPDITVQVDPSVQLFHLPMNTKKAPTDNIHLRKAIIYAFDYETAVKEIIPGSVQAAGPVPVRAWGHAEDVQPYHQDMEEAKKHFEMSGLKPGEVELDFWFPSSVPMERKIGLLLASNLQELGIKLNINPVQWANITEAAANVDTSPHLTGIFDTLKYPHPDSHTYGMYHPSCWGSYRCLSWYDNPEVTALLEKARATIDLEEQIELYKEAQRKIVEDAPSLYIANPAHRIAYRNHVKGYTYVGLLGYDLSFYTLRIEK
ncbi:MAG: ABC transporter substrate-binding protein [Anaerolineae bacterium]